MRVKRVLLIPLIVALLISLVYAAPLIPIGESSQAIPYESNPGAGTVTGFGTPTGGIGNAYDGDWDTNINFYYGASASGVLELTTFDNTPATAFTIEYVDFKISYKAAGGADDQYRILYYVGTAGPIILQDWTGDKFDPSGGAQAHRVWSAQAEPNDGVWSWTDILNVKVRVEGNWGANGANGFKRFYLYEAWLTIAPAPLPPGVLGAPVVSVQPGVVLGLTAGTSFFVDLYVGGATQMFAYEIKLDYDTTILTAQEYWSFHPFNSALPSEINDTAGYVAIAYSSYFGDPTGLTGNSPMARIYFTVDADGTSLLHFSKALWTDVFGVLFTADTNDGTFSTSPVRDVAVSDVRVNATQVMPGGGMAINVTVMNQGTIPESFDVTVLYDTVVIGTQTVTSLFAGSSRTITFAWDTTGVGVGHYQIKAEASQVTDETDLSDNTKTWSILWDSKVIDKVVIGRHDIAVSQVAVYNQTVTVDDNTKTLNVTQGSLVYINATVENQGTFTETFDVTALYESVDETPLGYRIIQTKTGISLDAGASTVVNFTWNTLTVKFRPPKYDSKKQKMVYYNETECTVKANTTEVDFEKGFDYDNTDDNTLPTALGDVRKVTVFRAAPVASFSTAFTEYFVNEPITFDASQSKSPENTEIVSYRWDFNDTTTEIYVRGVNLTEPHKATHNFTQAHPRKVYNVTLTVTNNLDFNANITKKLTVYTRDIAVIEVTPASPTAVIGEFLNVTVVIKNWSLKDEQAQDVNVTVYYGDTPIQIRNITVYYGATLQETFAAENATYGVGAVNTATNTTTLIFEWNTTSALPGTYTLKAVLKNLDYELDWENNTLAAGQTVTLLVHDVAVVSIEPSKTEASVGDSVSIEVFVVNEGDFTETFTVTLYYDETEIGTQTVTDLAAGDSETLTFNWETSGLKTGVYTLTAVASNVTGEMDTMDNTFLGDDVTLNPASSILLYAVAGIAIAIAIVAGIVLIYFLKFRKPKQKVAKSGS